MIDSVQAVQPFSGLNEKIRLHRYVRQENLKAQSKMVQLVQGILEKKTISPPTNCTEGVKTIEPVQPVQNRCSESTRAVPLVQPISFSPIYSISLPYFAGARTHIQEIENTPSQLNLRGKSAAPSLHHVCTDAKQTTRPLQVVESDDGNLSHTETPLVHLEARAAIPEFACGVSESGEIKSAGPFHQGQHFFLSREAAEILLHQKMAARMWTK